MTVFRRIWSSHSGDHSRAEQSRSSAPIRTALLKSRWVAWKVLASSSLSPARNEPFCEGRCPSRERLRRRWRSAHVRSSYGGCRSASWPAPSGGASPLVRVGESLTQSMSLDDLIHAPRSSTSMTHSSSRRQTSVLIARGARLRRRRGARRDGPLARSRWGCSGPAATFAPGAVRRRGRRSPARSAATAG
jgi:hypothetical protein